MKNIVIIWGLVVLACVLTDWIRGTNPTDAGKFERSGMVLYIDHGTGCHYLEAGMIGGITPRLDADGKQICSGSYR